MVVYSDDPAVRERVRLGVGRRPGAGLGRIDWVECATDFQVIEAVDGGGIDLCILDGEAQPAGGLGIARQLKDEIGDCPPVLVVVARADDAWLATWSRADAVLAHPLDPAVTADAVADLLRRRVAALPVRR